jgi:hypothetical protein
VLYKDYNNAALFVRTPSVKQIKLFLQWLVQDSNGQINSKITNITAKNYLSSLKRAIKDYTNYQYNAMQNNEIAAVYPLFKCYIDLC